MVIYQGEIYWIDLGPPAGSAPAYKHPHVVIQNDLFNQSRIATTVVCALTSNLKRAASPGNVLLRRGEANLKRECVVNISQLLTVDKAELSERIGKLSEARVREIIRGFELLIRPRSVD